MILLAHFLCQCNHFTLTCLMLWLLFLGLFHIASPLAHLPTHFFKFCRGGVLKGVTATACPGGVSFLSPLPPKTCVCTNGHWLGRVKKDDGAKDWGIIFANFSTKPCVEAKTSIFGLVPTLEDHVGEFGTRGRFRRISAASLRQKKRFSPYAKGSGSTDGGTFFWSQPYELDSIQNELVVSSGNGSSELKCGTGTIRARYYSSKIWGSIFTCEGSGGNETTSWSLKMGKKSQRMGGFQPVFSNEEISSTDVCSQQCNEDKDSWISRPMEAEWDWLSPDALHNRLRWETEQLAEYRIRRSIQEAHIHTEHHNYPRALRLLFTVSKILSKVGTKLLNSWVVDENFRLAEYLYFGLEGMLTEKEYVLINFGLERCLRYAKVITLDEVVCAKSNSTKSGGPRDLIVELLWKSVDLAHALCFQYFIHPNHHHLFGVAMHHFFKHPPVYLRWERKLSPKMLNVFPTVLPGLNQITLEMAEAAVETTHVKNPNFVHNNRLLKRPKRSKEKKPKSSSVEQCKGGRLIWGDSACCHSYDEATGIIPHMSDK